MLRLAEYLKREGFKIGGMATREIREKGVRVGFEILNLATGEKGILARVGGVGPRVGKYAVNLEGLNRVGVNAIQEAVQRADLIFVDEVGPMELYSESFKRAVREAAGSGKPLIATVHYRARDPLIVELKREAVRLLEVKREGWSSVFEEAVSTVVGWLRRG